MGGRLAIVGGGPAGLMAAETACAAGCWVDVYEAKGSVGRKFLIAGKGGLNLTHAEDKAEFIRRYRGREIQIERWLQAFDAQALRDWARGLGVETFVGTSGRVFPLDMKAAPLLRGWVRRLRESGVRFHTRHRCLGWDAGGDLRFATPDGEVRGHADAVVLAMGGGSWPELGSDGDWVAWLKDRDVAIAPLVPANCGFNVRWSDGFVQRYAGQPVKPVIIHALDADGEAVARQGEIIVTANGLEGSLIYAISGALRDAIAASGDVDVYLDLLPGRDLASLREALNKPRNGRSLSEHLRRAAGLEGVKAGLIRECLSKDAMLDMNALAAAIKALPVKLVSTRPIAEAISSAGGVRFEALNEALMLREHPGVFCAGEMVDWEAPTGGYLLTACFASGRIAGLGAAEWLRCSDH